MLKIASVWKRITFKGNISKMRFSLVDYLTTEGVNSQISDGVVLFEYDNCHFMVDFNLDSNYPECITTFEIEDDDYEALDITDKTFISDRVNTDMENHATVYTFNNSVKLKTSFFFTKKEMMLELFCLHFAELTQSIDLTLDITRCRIKERKESKSRRIGFNTEAFKQSEQVSEDTKVAVRALK